MAKLAKSRPAKQSAGRKKRTNATNQTPHKVQATSTGEAPSTIETWLGRPFSPEEVEAVEELQRLRQLVESYAIGRRMWVRVLTKDERLLLGDFESNWLRFRTIGTLLQVRSISVEEAVITISERVSLLEHESATWLRAELGLKLAKPLALGDRPDWNVELGELNLGNDVIRRCRVLREPSNIQQILDEFQAHAWPNRIENPLTLGQTQLHETLRYLNKDLKKIRFHGREGGRAVVLEVL